MKPAWLWGPLEIVAAAEIRLAGGRVVESRGCRCGGRDGSRAALGDGVRVWQEPASGGLVRVRVRWPGGEPADAAARLAAAGFDEAFRGDRRRIRA